ncbi:hypothetical protein AJ80_03243 [Polytolypa hystricis UAMH7299]|uniref:Uncharacterized protein n=1 Tax=Polytolypa hystricis (strain UAMH7299) TaxID=1447883 RepID=A0A2B7YKT1_POLH7|nr:hypothetical protein AJ80_03243 [Polytolypa hystricis UAMH7299]
MSSAQSILVSSRCSSLACASGAIPTYYYAPGQILALPRTQLGLQMATESRSRDPLRRSQTPASSMLGAWAWRLAPLARVSPLGPPACRNECGASRAENSCGPVFLEQFEAATPTALFNRGVDTQTQRGAPNKQHGNRVSTLRHQMHF